jgi:hypothetical protein
MRGTEKSKMAGTIIGKAMGNLEHERGRIEALVTPR